MANKEITCPQCGTEFVDEGGGTAATDEETHIIDHGMCFDCHKKWQLGELEDDT
jgi:hypothetical protein